MIARNDIITFSHTIPFSSNSVTLEGTVVSFNYSFERVASYGVLVGGEVFVVYPHQIAA